MPTLSQQLQKLNWGDLSCDTNSFEAPYPDAFNFQGDCPPLPQPDSWDHAIDIQSVHQLPGVISAIDSVIETSVLVEGSGAPKTSEEHDDDCELFRMDAIRAEVASVSCTYDPVLFCDLLDDNIALSKFATAVGSTTAKYQDPDSVIDFWDDPEPNVEHISEGSALMDVFASATHAEKPKGVNAELLQKIWRIDEKTAKRTIDATTQLNRQDLNSKLSRNFGTNDRMLR